MSSMSSHTRKAVENGAVDNELFNSVKSSLIIPHFAIISMPVTQRRTCVHKEISKKYE
jgi:hypothetical protein